MEKNNQRLSLWVLSISICITILGIVLLYIEHNLEEPYDKWAEHLGFVLIPLGTIEIIFHFTFSKTFVYEIIHSLIPSVQGTLENSMTRELAPKMENVLRNSLEDTLLPSFKDTINKEINKGYEVVYDAGIIGAKRSMNFIEFLNDALNHFANNRTKTKVDYTINVFCIYLEDFRPESNRKNDVEKLMIQLMTTMGCKLNFLLPDPKNSNMQFELWLRNNSANLGNNNPNQRLKKLEETINELEKLKEKHNNKIEIRYYNNFISFPLMNYDNIWYQGNYINDFTAEDIYYLKVKSFDNDSLGLANQWKWHFRKIWEASKERKNHFDHAGSYLNSISCSNLHGKTNHLFEFEKEYKILTHSLYTITDNAKTKNHYLSQWSIKIDCIRDGCYNCTLTTKTHAIDNYGLDEETYTGVCTYDKSGPNESANNVIFIFGKNKDGACTEPIIMSGKIQKDEQDVPGDIILLHITYFSKYYKNRVSKIGVLSRQSHKDKDLLPIEINDKFIEEIENNPVHLLLLRKHKVIMQSVYTRKDDVINSTDKIREWLRKKYIDLQINTDINDVRTGKYNLYYKVVDKPDGFVSAEINILSNGIIILKRKNARNEDETYYGEINARAKASKKDGVVFIKFIRTIDTVKGVQQDYNEIFMLLHWCGLGKKMKYSRGIILGQRDEGSLFPEENPVIEADRCYICRPKDEIANSDSEILKMLNVEEINEKDEDKRPKIKLKFAMSEDDEHSIYSVAERGTLTLQINKNQCK